LVDTLVPHAKHGRYRGARAADNIALFIFAIGIFIFAMFVPAVAVITSNQGEFECGKMVHPKVYFF